MCLIHSKADRWFVSYILRTSHQLDKHAGQISFPGGRKDVSDADLLACAIRETYEEIGIHADQIDLLGSLSPLYVYASHHYVQPFVGIIHEAPRYVLEPREVQRVIEVPLDLLTSHNVIKYTDLNIHGYQLHNVPYYDINGEILWGATAMMTSELIYLWN
jgi:8-oxo-dGTP pyrophosphatase MutT (NUDIX family)